MAQLFRESRKKKATESQKTIMTPTPTPAHLQNRLQLPTPIPAHLKNDSNSRIRLERI